MRSSFRRDYRDLHGSDPDPIVDVRPRIQPATRPQITVRDWLLLPWRLLELFPFFVIGLVCLAGAAFAFLIAWIALTAMLGA